MICSPWVVVVLPIKLTTTSRLMSGRPLQLAVMYLHDPTKYRDEGLKEAMNQLPSALVENTGAAFRPEP